MVAPASITLTANRTTLLAGQTVTLTAVTDVGVQSSASIQNRGLPSTRSGDTYAVFEVLQPLPVRSGVTAPWKDSGGGGIQYLTDKTIKELLDAGVLKRLR
jgi:hypothetical protein